MLDTTDTVYDPDAIFHEAGPLDPLFMADAIQALMRALPLDTPEPEAARRRRMNSALIALAATNPRDPIEVMLAVQAISAYHAACACWRIGVNLRHPRGDSTRHISAAATAARTFDSMLRAIERRQAKPLSVPVGRPASRVWTPDMNPTFLDIIAQRIQHDDEPPAEDQPQRPPDPVTWTPEALAIARQMQDQERFEEEHAGLDLAEVEGVLPGGGIIMPEYPTPQQEKYIARRVGLMYKREYADNLRKGIKAYPKIRPLRTGDLIP
ncbi:MAG TPA: hypothetical protein VGM32_16960 [Rhodopila sp.]